MIDFVFFHYTIYLLFVAKNWTVLSCYAKFHAQCDHQANVDHVTGLMKLITYKEISTSTIASPTQKRPSVFTAVFVFDRSSLNLIL